MRTLVTSLAVLYAISLAILAALRMQPTVPGLFVAGIVLSFVPLAYLFVEALYYAEPLPGFRSCPRSCAFVTGAVLFAVYSLLVNPALVMLPVLIVTVWHVCAKQRELLIPTAWSVVGLVLMYGSIWNLNQAIGPFTLWRLNDADILATDLAIYGQIYGHAVKVNELFPWHPSKWIFSLFETAYFFLFCEVFVVIFVYARQRISPAGFFASALSAYLFALLVYCIYPVSGPHYFVPESLAEPFRSTRTFALMTQMNMSYEDILAGRPTSGFAYLVALPSLHVTMAVLMQGFLRVSKVHFWALLPANVLMALSTVYLGYHYLVDVVGGVALAAVVLAVHRACEARTWNVAWVRSATRRPPSAETVTAT